MSNHFESLKSKYIKNEQDNSNKDNKTYKAENIIGNGSFGIVYLAICQENQEKVAIKTVFQDQRYKNRELELTQKLKHPNIIGIKEAFYTTQNEKDIYLNIVMEYIPDTFSQVIRKKRKQSNNLTNNQIKILGFQMFRSLIYLHSLKICHRDIKPQNLLFDEEKNIIKLCDFGSAKMLSSNEPNISYICSRYYRAPELIFGAENYGFAIDV